MLNVNPQFRVSKDRTQPKVRLSGDAGKRSQPELLDKYLLLSHAARDQRLTKLAVAVLARIIEHYRADKGDALASDSFLARELGCSRRGVRAAVPLLVRHGYLTKLSGDETHSNRYVPIWEQVGTPRFQGGRNRQVPGVGTGSAASLPLTQEPLTSSEPNGSSERARRPVRPAHMERLGEKVRAQRIPLSEAYPSPSWLQWKEKSYPDFEERFGDLAGIVDDFRDWHTDNTRLQFFRDQAAVDRKFKRWMKTQREKVIQPATIHADRRALKKKAASMTPEQRGGYAEDLKQREKMRRHFDAQQAEEKKDRKEAQQYRKDLFVKQCVAAGNSKAVAAALFVDASKMINAYHDHHSEEEGGSEWGGSLVRQFPEAIKAGETLAGLWRDVWPVDQREALRRVWLLEKELQKNRLRRQHAIPDHDSDDDE